jgi:PRTRC genetic system ThiF family protein
MKLDTEYLNARKLILPSPEKVVLHLVGCGGTGSWLAPDIARIALLLREKFHKEVVVVYQDMDVVEEKNVFRQNFCYAEIGKNKAETLASRYGHAWGIETVAITEPFEKKPSSDYNTLYVMIGCADNALARRALHETLYTTEWTHSHYVWLDCGNTKNYGQILVGTEYRTDKTMPNPFAIDDHCTWLPSPAIQHTELLEALPEESRPEGNLSCADLALQDSQGLSINKRVAAEAADFLIKMLITQDLKRFACYMDLESGSTQSLYISSNQLKQYLQEG